MEQVLEQPDERGGDFVVSLGIKDSDFARVSWLSKNGLERGIVLYGDWGSAALAVKHRRRLEVTREVCREGWSARRWVRAGPTFVFGRRVSLDLPEPAIPSRGVRVCGDGRPRFVGRLRDRGRGACVARGPGAAPANDGPCARDHHSRFGQLP